MTCERSEFVTNAYEDTAKFAKFERLSNIISIRKHFREQQKRDGVPPPATPKRYTRRPQVQIPLKLFVLFDHNQSEWNFTKRASPPIGLYRPNLRYL